MAALEEHERFYPRISLSKKGNMHHRRFSGCFANNELEVSVLDASNSFYVTKKGLNVEELFQMNNLIMQLEL
jgi:hypothetical protein